MLLPCSHGVKTISLTGGELDNLKKCAHIFRYIPRCIPLPFPPQSYEDAGPIIDAVVWHDGSKWTAALDTSDFYADLHAGLADAPAPAAPAAAVAEELNPEEVVAAAGAGGGGAADSAGAGIGGSGGGGGKNDDGSVTAEVGRGRLADFTPMTSFRCVSRMRMCVRGMRLDVSWCVFACVHPCMPMCIHA